MTDNTMAIRKRTNNGEMFEDTKGYSESVNRRRTDKTMAKKKKHKRTNKGEQFEDTKGVIGIRKSKKNRQHNG